MKKSNCLKTGLKIRHQSGAALLIGMVVMASVVAFYLMGQFGAVSTKHERQVSRVASLAEAKKALIAHAVNYIDANDGEMGFLPCPTNGINPTEGVQDLNCNATNLNAIGRFPWRSLDTSPQRDESNECIWYAVSGYYKANPKTEMLNDDTNGMFEVYNSQGTPIYGSAPEDRVVAVLIAPGTALQGQARNTVAGTERCRGNYTVANYLEGDGVYDNSSLNGNADQADSFIKAGTNSDIAVTPFNDLILTISRDEIWNAVKRRRDFNSNIEGLTDQIAQCILDYGNANTNRHLPWPAELDMSATEYREGASYTDIVPVNGLFGRLPNIVTNSEQFLEANLGGGGTGDGIPTTPPTGGADCTECWDKLQEELTKNDEKYLKEVDKANDKYDKCVDKDKDPVELCEAERQEEIAEEAAKKAKENAKEIEKYVECLNSNSCSGADETNICDGCTTAKQAEVNEAQASYNEEVIEAEIDYQECIADGKSDCDEKKTEDLDEANEDLVKDLAKAQENFAKCTENLTMTCDGTGGGGGASGGKKNIDPLLNLSCLAPNELTLWENWKDHFFYVVSEGFAPNPNDATCTASGNCVSVSGVDRAGIVIYSGERLNGQTRNDPVSSDAGATVDADSKNDINNYLEGDNAANYPDVNGSDAYSTGANGNDYMICINEGASVGDNLTKSVCP